MRCLFLHRNSSLRSKVGLVQLNGRSRGFALSVCAAVVFCAGADMAVVAGAQKTAGLVLAQPPLLSTNLVTGGIIFTPRRTRQHARPATPPSPPAPAGLS